MAAGRYRPTLEHSVKRGLVVFLASLALVGPSTAQPAPPAVGVVRAERQQITQIDEFIGRIQAVNRVAIVARVTAFLEKRLFVEGSEVKQGDLLYLLEQPPFQAQVDANKAAVEQLEAQHRNAQISLNRAQELLRSATGPQANVDTTLAAAKLVFTGVPEKYPRIKWALTHLGGAIPYLAERLDRGHRAFKECRVNIQRPPSEYLKKFYFDTVNFNTDALKLAIAFAGADHLLAGSDYAHQIGSPKLMLESIRALDISEYNRAKILSGNAARLLGLS